MKKKFQKNLKLSKKTISGFNDQAIKGGFSEGCSDGCTPLQTWLNCSAGNCSDDCTGGSYPQCMPPPTRKL